MSMKYLEPRTSSQVKKLQRDLNTFTEHFLLDVTKLRVDGDFGPATRKRVKLVKYYLGFTRPRTSNAGAAFLRRLDHPFSPLAYGGVRQTARGIRRRHKQRRLAREHRERARKTEGVGHFDGKAVANWLIPYLEWARRNGWEGTVASGWRDPAYSERLCYAMCGAPSCPGTCAGRSSNHSGSSKPRGAIDVTYYYSFGKIIAKCPYEPKIYNALGVRDPVHFSATGR